MSSSNGTKKRGRPRDEPALIAALVRGTLAVASDPRAALTVDSVVAAAGTSKPRVYRYFPSAEAAFSRVLGEILSESARLLCETLRAAGPANERFGKLQEALASPSMEQRSLLRLELMALQQAATDANLSRQVSATDTQVLTALGALMSEVERERGLWPGYSADEAARALWQLRRGCLAALLSTEPEAGPLALEVLSKFWREVTRQTEVPPIA